MNDHAGPEPRQHFQNFEKYVSLTPDEVRGVDEQHIIGVERLKQAEVERFDSFAHDPNAELFEPRRLVRLNADVLARVSGIMLHVQFGRSSCDQSRKSAADFQYAFRFPAAD